MWCWSKIGTDLLFSADAVCVERWSKPGDLVIDPFLGSGSTAIAALCERRDCSGAELDGGYVDKMVDRMHSLCPVSIIDVV